MKKQFSTIAITVLYLLMIRFSAELQWFQINSLSYLIIAPIVIGFIPLFIKNNSTQNIVSSLVIPILSVFLFLITLIIIGMEEPLGFIIIGFPYLLFSITTSILLRKTKLTQEEKIVPRSYWIVLLLPFISSAFENKIEQTNILHETQTSLIINADKNKIWSNLHAVPNLTNHTTTSLLNQIGIPKPIKSEYDPIQNIRLGYFDNGLILNEKVIEEARGRKLSFSINFKKSQLKNNPSIEKQIKEKSIQFEKISYELTAINSTQTRLKLSCKYKIRSNLQFYGSYLANKILSDFESNLLNSLKSKIENGTASLSISKK